MAETVPLFPLGTVLLPGASLPLHIFEPRYRQLTVDLVTGAVPGRSFGVIAVKQGLETAEETTHDIGCTAVLREARRLPDGRFDIVTRGEKRFRLLDIDETSAPYLVGSVEWVPDDDPPHDELMLLPMLSRAAREAHRRYCSAAWQHGDWKEPAADVDVAALPHLLAADCLLTLEDRQALLEECDPADRLRLVRTLLVREAAFLRALRAVPVPLNQFAVHTSRN
ncbi:MAG: LON peptidase substrate-binding domain-containing protein [Actinomycetota bacterium]|nr:LON peptidase substrate-binding domain-containing protein [Actinomycetota bacterium]HEU0128129.1 LON peptidase substrate-binding domain-containing protein [Pseudonocardiaceae bacterium]